MTTPNVEELISMLRAKGCPDWVTARWLMESAADLLQSQAERIKELELDLDIQAGSIEAVQAANSRLAAERDTLRAELAAIAATEPVYYEFQWTNPGNQPHQPESMFVWARVEPAWNGTVQQKVDELLAYRYDDKPTYRVRALFTRPMPAQDVTELVEALQLFAYALPLDKSTIKTCYAVTDQMRDAAHAALSKYKGAK